MLRPIADQSEYRPPTQSQNLNMLFVSIPNADTALLFVERATKCLATCLTSFALSRNQDLADSAFVIVS